MNTNDHTSPSNVVSRAVCTARATNISTTATIEACIAGRFPDRSNAICTGIANKNENNPDRYNTVAADPDKRGVRQARIDKRSGSVITLSARAPNIGPA
jgi:hypothetical protein